MDFEYGIIGGGPAGYTAGMMLAKQGHSVVLFEKDILVEDLELTVRRKMKLGSIYLGVFA